MNQAPLHSLADLLIQDTVIIPSAPAYNGVIRNISAGGVTLSTKQGLILLSRTTPARLISRGAIIHGTPAQLALPAPATTKPNDSMTYLPTKPHDLPNQGLTDHEIYNNAYQAAYAEAIDAEFTPNQAAQYANRHAFDVFRALNVSSPLPKKPEPAPVVMRTIADLAEIIKPPPILPIQPHEKRKPKPDGAQPLPDRRDPDLLDDEAWSRMYGQYY